MRKDVKFGLALSLVVVVMAGWYYSRGGEKGQAIPLVEAETSDAAVAARGEGVPTRVEPMRAEGPSPEQPGSGAVSTGRPGSGRPGSASPVANAGDGASRVEPIHPAADERVASAAPVESASDMLAASRAPGPDGRVSGAEGRDLGDEGGDPGASEGAKSSDSPFDLPAMIAASVGGGRDEPASSRSSREARPIVAAPAVGGEAPVGGAAPASSAPSTRVQERANAENGAVESYTVQPGDTFAVLAEIYYGSQSFASYLMQANPQVENAAQLRAGYVIRIPPPPAGDPTAPPSAASEQSAASKPATGAGADGARQCIVKPGDSFYRIAVRELGSGARWQEIFELNKTLVDGDAKGLRPGMVLVLPAK